MSNTPTLSSKLADCGVWKSAFLLLAMFLACGMTCQHAEAQNLDPFSLTEPQENSNEQDQTDSAGNNSTAQDEDGNSQNPNEGSDEASGEESAEESVEDVANSVIEQSGEFLQAVGRGDWATAREIGSELFATYVLRAIAALLVLIVAYFVAAFVARICSNPVRSRVDETFGRFIDKLVFYVIMVCALLGVLQFFGIGVASFAAVIAAAGFAVGLAFQGTLSNFASGIMLLVFRPFKVGDVVQAAGITAKIYEIDLFHTVFDTFDNRRIIVPNSSIVEDTIENISHHPQRRVDVNVGVDYGASIDKTRATLSAAAESLKEKMIQGDNRGYQVYLLDLGDSSVNWVVRFWTKNEDFWGVKEELTAAVKNHLDAADIGIPFPQMDVHLKSQVNSES